MKKTTNHLRWAFGFLLAGSLLTAPASLWASPAGEPLPPYAMQNFYHIHAMSEALQQEARDRLQKEQALKAAQEEEAKKEELAAVQAYTKLPLEVVVFMAKEAEKRHIPLSIFVGLMQLESDFNVEEHNESSGAMGLGQVMPSTGKELAARSGMEYHYEDLMIPTYNIRLSLMELSECYKKTRDWDAALTSYNRGYGGYLSYATNHGTAESGYSRTVLRYAEQVREKTGIE